MCAMPGHEDFPLGLVQALRALIECWLLPLYPFTEDEDFGMLNDDDLLGTPLPARHNKLLYVMVTLFTHLHSIAVPAQLRWTAASRPVTL